MNFTQRKKSGRENNKAIMKSHRLHPEMGHSMHYIRLVRGENTKKLCTYQFIETENIVV